MAINSENGDYLLSDVTTKEPIVQRLTLDEGVLLTFSASKADLIVNIEFDEEMQMVKSVSYEVGGVSSPPRYVYTDSEGDGQFDHLIDYVKGTVHIRNGLIWEEKGRREFPNEKK